MTDACSLGENLLAARTGPTPDAPKLLGACDRFVACALKALCLCSEKSVAGRKNGAANDLSSPPISRPSLCRPESGVDGPADCGRGIPTRMRFTGEISAGILNMWQEYPRSWIAPMRATSTTYIYTRVISALTACVRACNHICKRNMQLSEMTRECAIRTAAVERPTTAAACFNVPPQRSEWQHGIKAKGPPAATAASQITSVK